MVNAAQLEAELERRVWFVELDARTFVNVKSNPELSKLIWEPPKLDSPQTYHSAIGKGDYMMSLAGMACLDLLALTNQILVNREQVWNRKNLELIEKILMGSKDSWPNPLNRAGERVWNLSTLFEPNLLGLKSLKETEMVWKNMRHSLAHTYSFGKNHAPISLVADSSSTPAELTEFISGQHPVVQLVNDQILVFPETLCLSTLRKALNHITPKIHVADSRTVACAMLSVGGFSMKAG